MKRCFLLLALLFDLTAVRLSAEEAHHGILDEHAPAWGVSQWLNLPQGKTAVEIGDFKGKVVYLYAFQSWCPGCHQHGFPTLKEVIKRYGRDSDVAIVAVQTAFEGFSANSFEQAKQVAARYGLQIPVGHSGTAREPSLLMRRYRTGGTPWTVIIDRAGIVRFNAFHLDANASGLLIEQWKSPRPAGGAPDGSSRKR